MPLVLNVAAAAAVLVAALWSTVLAPTGDAAPPRPGPRPAVALWAGAQGGAVADLDTLTLEAKVGQIVAARAGGDVDALARAGRVGRVVVAERDLDRHLEAVRAWQGASAVPVLVATEPGAMFGLGIAGTPRFPAAVAYGAADRPDLTYMTGKAMAEAARAVGVQAPGAPLGAGPSAFGDGSAERSGLAVALARGLRDGDVLPTATVAAADLAEGRGGDLDALVDAGLMEVRLVPAPRSTGAAAAAAVRALRERHGFTGLVVVDAEGRDSLALPALRAGADQVLTDRPAALGQRLAADARAGRLAPGRLDDVAGRVLRAKAWAGLAAPPRARPASEGGAAAVRVSPWRPPSAGLLHRADLLGGEVARAAVTVVQDAGGPVPVVGPRAPRRVVAIALDAGADDAGTGPFADALADALDLRSSHRLGLGDSAAAYAAALDAARQADLVVLGAAPDGDGLAARHREIAADLLRGGVPVVAAVLGSPSALVGLPRPAALVAAWDGGEATQRAAAAAIAGQVAVAGRLPTSVAGLYASGDGVRLRQQRLRPGSPEEAGLAPDVVEDLDRVVAAAVRDGAFPGATLAVGRGGVLVRLRGYGRLSRGGAAAPTPQTAYDLASLTKVVATTTAVMRLVEAGEIDLDARVAEYVPAYRPQGGRAVTVRQLLTHSAGHRPFYPFYARDILDREGVLDFVYADTLRYRPGARSVYSDFDMIVLGEVVEAVAGEPFDRHLRRTVFDPLGMDRTGFRPAGAVDRTAAPTERDRAWRGRVLQGEVHDEAASVMGGVAGHAGLFSTAEDLATFGFLLANGGVANGARLFRRTTLDAFTRRVPLRGTYPMGLGWMLRPTDRGYSSSGRLFGPRSFGHTGFTGTSIWVDPDQDLFVVLLTNRVHPTRRARGIREARAAVADAVAGAVAAPPGEPARAWGFGPLPDDLYAAVAR